MSIGVDSPSVSQHLSTSHPSLHSTKKASSEISRTYKHVSQLYLTRQLKEAYDLLQPTIKPPKPSIDELLADEQPVQLAPIALATTSQRIKIWSLYITLMNEACEIGPREGADQFGSGYRGMVNNATQGGLWEQVVRDGYQGREGSVDAEVVYNLSNFLLGQAKDQQINQSRLETYLASSSVHLELDLTTHLSNSLSSSRSSHMGGTNTPKDLSSRIKILELFTLHVLPRNEEWEYAKSFIANSDVLDEERKEAFLQTLQELQDSKDEDQNMFTDAEEVFENAEDVPDEPQQPMANGMSNGTGSNTMTSGAASPHKKSSSEVDYGIDQSRPNGTSQPNSLSTSTSTTMTSLPPQPLQSATSSPSTQKLSSTSASKPAQSANGKPLTKASTSSSSSSKSKPRSSRKAVAQPKTIINRIQRLLTIAYVVTTEVSISLVSTPAALVKTTMFIIGLLALFGRRDMRERILQILRTGWGKVKGTAGMGMKVSYI